MTKPYEAPNFDTVKGWRARLLEACEKIETLPPSELQTAIVTLVSRVSSQMQDAMMDYDTYKWRGQRVAVCIACQPVVVGETRTEPQPAPTCSRCGKACDAGHWVMTVPRCSDQGCTHQGDPDCTLRCSST